MVLWPLPFLLRLLYRYWVAFKNLSAQVAEEFGEFTENAFSLHQELLLRRKQALALDRQAGLVPEPSKRTKPPETADQAEKRREYNRAWMRMQRGKEKANRPAVSPSETARRAAKKLPHRLTPDQRRLVLNLEVPASAVAKKLKLAESTVFYHRRRAAQGVQPWARKPVLGAK
jgi:hypothetical protein